ncbi:MAG: hypothetical protein JSV74_04095 [Dehalococcoidia bacterium]|nr:MAG: hypothetical protein JSV74_04095 [Dehalococcoidia bacterium]
MNEQMDEPRWKLYQHIANRYKYLAFYEDPEDLYQDIIVALERWDKKENYQASDSRIYYEARHVIQRYTRKHEKEKNVTQYDTTKDDEPDDDGKLRLRMDELVADKESPDLDAWLEAKDVLKQLEPPMRLLEIAQKRVEGHKLSAADEMYLIRWRDKLKNKYEELTQD